MRNTIKCQVTKAVSEVVKELQEKGVRYVRFKDIEFDTDEYHIQCHTPYYFNGWACYEVRLAFEFMREHFPYLKVKVEGKDGNSKFFEILN